MRTKPRRSRWSEVAGDGRESHVVQWEVALVGGFMRGRVWIGGALQEPTWVMDMSMDCAWRLASSGR